MYTPSRHCKDANKIRTIPSGSLTALVHALLDHLPEDSAPVVITVKPDPSSPGLPKPNGHRTNPGALVYDPSVVYILELSTLLAIRDEASTAAVGKDVAETLQNIVRAAADTHPLTVSRAVYYLLHLLDASHVSQASAESLPLADIEKEHSFIRAPVILHTISSLNQPTLEKSALPILKGLTLCIREPTSLRSEIVNSPDFWSTIRSLHSLPEASHHVFDLVQSIINDTPSAVTADNYEATVTLLKDFAVAGSVGAVMEQRRDKNPRTRKPPKQLGVKSVTLPLHTPSLYLMASRDNEFVERGVKAVKAIYQLSSRVPKLIEKSHLERTEAWATYWSPIFRALSTQCVNPCREIRYQAFSGLQRALLSPELASPDHQEWTAIFGEVLFPLISQLLKPEVYHSDPTGMSETRVQAATLLCKVFLHYLVLLSEWEGMLDLWLHILDIMDRLMNSGQSDSLEEAVPESLKNILLVMADGGYLVPPSEDPQQAMLWIETWKRLERFLPGMFREIFPEKTNPPPQPVTPKTPNAPPPPTVKEEPLQENLPPPPEAM